MLWIAHIGPSLCVETDGVEGDENSMEKGRHNWIKDVGDEHDPFDEEEKDGEHGDDDVVVCHAVRLSLNQSYTERLVEEENVQFAPR